MQTLLIAYSLEFAQNPVKSQNARGPLARQRSSILRFPTSPVMEADRGQRFERMQC